MLMGMACPKLSENQSFRLTFSPKHIFHQNQADTFSGKIGTPASI
jgi:hypothetical protein